MSSSKTLCTEPFHPHFRRILPSDDALVLMAGAVHAASWQESHRAIVSPEFLALHTPERQSAFLQGELAAQKELYGAFLGDTPAGIVVLDPQSGEISSLYVLPTRWGQGIGSGLLRFSQKHLSVLGRSPWLSVLSTNERARRFYERRGFVFSGEAIVRNETARLFELRYVPAPQDTPSL